MSMKMEMEGGGRKERREERGMRRQRIIFCIFLNFKVPIIIIIKVVMVNLY